MNDLVDLWAPFSLTGGWRGMILAPEFPSPGTATAQALRRTLEALVTDPASLRDAKHLKFDPHAKVIRTELETNGQRTTVVCKYARASGIIKRVAAGLRPSRAERNARRALSLRRAGIPTAIPLAWVERSWPHVESWLMTEFVSGLIDLDRIALRDLPTCSASDGRRLKNAICASVADLLVRLSAAGLTHRDFKASNILMNSSVLTFTRTEAWLLDLDGLARLGRRNLSSALRPVVRLTASLAAYDGVTQTDLARLLQRVVTNADLPGVTWRQAFRMVAGRAGRYARAAVRRKQAKLDGFAGDVRP